MENPFSGEVAGNVRLLVTKSRRATTPVFVRFMVIHHAPTVENLFANSCNIKIIMSYINES